MNWFKNLKIRMKMFVGFGLIIVLMAGLAVTAGTQLRTVDDTYSLMISYTIEGEIIIKDFWAVVLDIRRITGLASAFAATDDRDRIASLGQSARDSYNNGVQLLDKYVDQVKANPLTSQAEKDERLRRVTEIRSLFDAYKTQSMEPIIEAALRLDHGRTMEVILAGTAGANDLMNATSELLEIITGTVNNSGQNATANANRIILLLTVISVIAVLIAIIVAMYLAGLIGKPLQALNAFMVKASTTGDIALAEEDERIIGGLMNIKDELGQAIGATAAFVARIAYISTELESVANSDLTSEIVLLSDKDAMGLSLQKMVANLNDMFGEINAATGQVSMGSKQVADGATSLAQGSMEQATSVEEVSSAIAAIAQKSKDNADMAMQAAELANTIKGNAEKGSSQMDEMMIAVKEINQASQSISKVIKAIDDIAFQTNILALNAAVEAARAGQYGKGFAVVADKVRSLAAKSAQAAKESGAIIQNSMEKAEFGAQIAAETAASLVEIVAGINESDSIINQIAAASEEQTDRIGKVDADIDLVAQIIQQNSATAEQSAAASEEMSSQANMLEELVAQFKLK